MTCSLAFAAETQQSFEIPCHTDEDELKTSYCQTTAFLNLFSLQLICFQNANGLVKQLYF